VGPVGEEGAVGLKIETALGGDTRCFLRSHGFWAEGFRIELKVDFLWVGGCTKSYRNGVAGGRGIGETGVIVDC
jgi:hypothetical protein